MEDGDDRRRRFAMTRRRTHMGEVAEKRGYVGRTGAVLAAVALAAAMPALAAGPDAEAYRAWGKDLFATYCASCHGVDGKGDGPVAKGLKTPPKDLTRIAERNEGKLPPNLVEEIIDGRQYFVAHGDRTMPIWGDVFAQGKGDYAARIRVYALRTYLESIQEAPMSHQP
jgi:mono/diheme cytochrome c family protein